LGWGATIVRRGGVPWSVRRGRGIYWRRGGIHWGNIGRLGHVYCRLLVCHCLSMMMVVMVVELLVQVGMLNHSRDVI
jgi:hypothetical protein